MCKNRYLGLYPAKLTVIAGLIVAALALPVSAGQDAAAKSTIHHKGPWLLLPIMDSEHGKLLFVTKGCVVCHSINGVGGTDAPKLDASTVPGPMNPLDFAARMWNHSVGMVAMQQAEMGGQVRLSGDELGDIIAFAHDANMQSTFSNKDLPPEIREKLEQGD